LESEEVPSTSRNKIWRKPKGDITEMSGIFADEGDEHSEKDVKILVKQMLPY
jgi:hypothetical protein